MNYSFEYIDIILLAMIAGFIFLRLRGILGKRTGFEGKAPSQLKEVIKTVNQDLKKKVNENFLIGNRINRKDSLFRIIISKMFKIYHRLLFNSKISDPSCPYVLFTKKNFLNIKKKLNFMEEGFWWGFTACSLINNYKFIEISINHKDRIDGKTNVYKLNKIPLIAINNAIGLLKIKLIR